MLLLFRYILHPTPQDREKQAVSDACAVQYDMSGRIRILKISDLDVKFCESNLVLHLAFLCTSLNVSLFVSSGSAFLDDDLPECLASAYNLV